MSIRTYPKTSHGNEQNPLGAYLCHGMKHGTAVPSQRSSMAPCIALMGKSIEDLLHGGTFQHEDIFLFKL